MKSKYQDTLCWKTTQSDRLGNFWGHNSKLKFFQNIWLLREKVSALLFSIYGSLLPSKAIRKIQWANHQFWRYKVYYKEPGDVKKFLNFWSRLRFNREKLFQTKIILVAMEIPEQDLKYLHQFLFSYYRMTIMISFWHTIS